MELHLLHSGSLGLYAFHDHVSGLQKVRPKLVPVGRSKQSLAVKVLSHQVIVVFADGCLCETVTSKQPLVSELFT